MSDETTKARARRLNNDKFHRAFRGVGLDIGCGPDPLSVKAWPNITQLDTFDLQDGNAQFITKHRPREHYDFVYSSNCLEHMNHPKVAIREWFGIVKYGGYLVFTVPDEDLYEQGVFPSRFNGDHKWTWTMHNRVSWSPKSMNVFDLLSVLDDCEILSVELVDTNYDHSKSQVDQTLGDAEAFIEVVLKKAKPRYKYGQ